jgi:dTMP kinase
VNSCMNLISQQGAFIVFEGIDGAGKSSHIQPVADMITRLGREVVLTRESGGTPLGEKLRSILLSDQMDGLTEAMLMFAARNEHIKTVIRPALDRGAVVLCDRFNDSTFAYQGGGTGYSWRTLEALEFIAGNLTPDLTLYFDLNPEIAAKRRADNRSHQDKFESNDVAYFQRVRKAYLARFADAPSRRISRLDASKALDLVGADVASEIDRFFSCFCKYPN